RVLDQALLDERLRRHLVAGLEPVEIADVDGLRVGAERADRHRVLRRGTAQLAEPHVDLGLSALEACRHLVRARARLLALDAAAGVAALAGAEATPDAFPVLPRLCRLEVGEIQLLLGHKVRRSRS